MKHSGLGRQLKSRHHVPPRILREGIVSARLNPHEVLMKNSVNGPELRTCKSNSIHKGNREKHEEKIQCNIRSCLLVIIDRVGNRCYTKQHQKKLKFNLG